jgi:light-independent protochlorophyllide reductase subunit B
MQLALWTYEGPPHIGAMRVATAMRGVHYVLHAPQGDTYADLLFTMIERRGERPPVTYTTFQARDLGGDTAGLFKDALQDANERFRPELIMVGASCTAELIQDDPGGLAAGIGLDVPVVKLELPAYQKKENWGAAETFYQLVRACVPRGAGKRVPDGRPRCNILGPTALGFRHRDDLVEVQGLLRRIGVEVNVTAPARRLARRPRAAAGCGFQRGALPGGRRPRGVLAGAQPGPAAVRTVPIGVGATRDFVAEVARARRARPGAAAG